jgi:uncharacterized protein YecT (DUF1311 family)
MKVVVSDVIVKVTTTLNDKTWTQYVVIWTKSGNFQQSISCGVQRKSQDPKLNFAPLQALSRGVK